MLKGLYTAWTGMVNEQKRMDILTNNMANASTVGFKREGSTSQSFDDILAVKIKDASEGLRNVRRVGINNPGVRIGETYEDYTQGSFRITDNTYDLAIAGEGFFAVEFTNKAGETSTKYTRAGQFALTSDGFITNENGDFLLDANSQRIQIDPLKETVIDGDGAVFQDDQQVAQIRLVDFEDYNYLQKYGETYFQPVEGARMMDGTGKIQQGYLEMSNVNIVSEMVNLIAITRAYESSQKIIQTYDGSLDIAVNQIGKLG